MIYRKKNSKIKSIMRMGGVLTHSSTGEVYTPNELLGCEENDQYINKKGFNKTFRTFSKEMQYDELDYGYCVMWTNYGLDKNNVLSNDYLDYLKKKMSSVGVVKLLQRLISKNMIARTGRGKYTLNPDIAQYGLSLPKSIYKLFEG